MPSIRIELSENDVKGIIIEKISSMLGDIEFNQSNLNIEVKSKQNYKAEWEKATFRAIYEGVK